jgi:hypothetical protein
VNNAALPNYADGGLGFPVFRAPYFQKDAQLAAFIFNADFDALSALCDSTLNVSADFEYCYKPISSSLMLVFADMLVSSRDERDARVGFIPEAEIGFWVLTLAWKKNLPHHLAWFLPYIFVDEGNSIATGREVFGFNKQFARIAKPERLQKPEFSAEVLGFQQFGADKIAQPERLLHLRPFAASMSFDSGDLKTIQTSLMDETLRQIRAGLDNNLVQVASRLLNDHIPLVFLKQFRDANDSRKACYQQVIEAPVKVEQFHEGGVFFRPYMLSLEALASHPLAKKLGLKNSQSSRIGVWMKVDFLLG